MYSDRDIQSYAYMIVQLHTDIYTVYINLINTLMKCNILTARITAQTEPVTDPVLVMVIALNNAADATEA